MKRRLDARLGPIVGWCATWCARRSVSPPGVAGVRRQAGQSLVELALLTPILLWLALGLVDFGRAFSTHVGLTNAAREGARYATLIAPTCNIPAIRGQTRAEQSSLAIADSMITVDCSQADRRTVRITYPFQPISFPIAEALDRPHGSGTIPLTTWATLPVMAQ